MIAGVYDGRHERTNLAVFALWRCSTPGAPAVDIDPFSLEFFADPYPSHAALRDAGRVVWLSRYNIAATARYAEVRQALQDYKTFSSARGVGLADFTRHGRFRLPSLILEADPPTIRVPEPLSRRRYRPP